MELLPRSKYRCGWEAAFMARVRVCSGGVKGVPEIWQFPNGNTTPFNGIMANVVF